MPVWWTPAGFWTVSKLPPSLAVQYFVLLFWFLSGLCWAPGVYPCAPSCSPGLSLALAFLVEEKCVSEVKNLPFKFLCSLDQDYNSYPGLNTKWPCYSFPQIFWKAKSEARENTGLNPVLLEPQINGIYMKVGFGLLHLSLIALSLAEYKYCMMPQCCTRQSAQRCIFPYWTRQIL